MLVADILNPYSVAVMHGVETACREHGYSLWCAIPTATTSRSVITWPPCSPTTSKD
ncbi:hypothetical protein P4234_16690 [Pseudomonas aeruginosa]|nr:hypothetical protein [Pseudomonas aeruginosa]